MASRMRNPIFASRLTMGIQIACYEMFDNCFMRKKITQEQIEKAYEFAEAYYLSPKESKAEAKKVAVARIVSAGINKRTAIGCIAFFDAMDGANRYQFENFLKCQ